MTSNDEMERQIFDDWAKAQGYECERHGRQYSEPMLDWAWIGWQAALKSKQGEV